MQKFRIPYIPYRSLLLSTTVLNDIQPPKHFTIKLQANAVFSGFFSRHYLSWMHFINKATSIYIHQQNSDSLVHKHRNSCSGAPWKKYGSLSHISINIFRKII